MEAEKRRLAIMAMASTEGVFSTFHIHRRHPQAEIIPNPSTHRPFLPDFWQSLDVAATPKKETCLPRCRLCDRPASPFLKKAKWAKTSSQRKTRFPTVNTEGGEKKSTASQARRADDEGPRGMVPLSLVLRIRLPQLTGFHCRPKSIRH